MQYIRKIYLSVAIRIAGLDDGLDCDAELDRAGTVRLVNSSSYQSIIAERHVSSANAPGIISVDT